jgi:chromosome partitioning protein
VADVIAIANQKGGVGKTTCAINLAGALAEQEYRILCIDMDAQANLTVGLGINLGTVDSSMADVLADSRASMREVIIPTQTAGIDVAPSTLELASTEVELFTAIGREHALREAIDGFVHENYDYVLIDCPPTLGLLTVNALVAATHLLIPIQSSYFALEGTDDLLETIEKVRQRPNPALRILGVVITMHDKRTALGRDIREQIQKVFGGKVFDTVIAKSVRLEESPAYKESIFTFAPDSSGATDYYSLCEEVIERVEARTA